MKRFRQLLGENYVFVLFILLFAAGLLGVPNFTKPTNLYNLLLSASIYGIAGTGAAFTLLTGAVDLSIGMQVAMSSILACVLTQSLGFWPGLALTLLFGCLTGLFNGAMVNFFKVSPMIITLGTMSILRGLGMAISSRADIRCADAALSGLFGRLLLGFFPLPTFIFLLILACGVILLRRTELGVDFYVIGGNQHSGYMLGIPVAGVRLAAFVLSGLLAALMGVFLASRMNTGSVSLGDDMTVSIISSCVIGGVSITGGKGSLLRMSAGVLLIQTVNNIMSLLAVAASAQLFITGLILVLVLMADRALRPRSRKGAFER